MLSGQLAPINQLSSMSPMGSPVGPHSSAVSALPPASQFPQPPMPAAAVPIKKEIVFPPDSVESVSPVLSRRRKLQKVSTLLYLIYFIIKVTKKLSTFDPQIPYHAWYGIMAMM